MQEQHQTKTEKPRLCLGNDAKEPSLPAVEASASLALYRGSNAGGSAPGPENRPVAYKFQNIKFWLLSLQACLPLSLSLCLSSCKAWPEVSGRIEGPGM